MVKIGPCPSLPTWSNWLICAFLCRKIEHFWVLPALVTLDQLFCQSVKYTVYFSCPLEYFGRFKWKSKINTKGSRLSYFALQYNDAAIVAVSGSPERISICLTLIDDWKIYSRVNCHHPAKKFLLFWRSWQTDRWHGI